ncbi:Putative ribonuclease H protein At1g65750 [Linum perenne]
MQTSVLPITTCNAIDKRIRKFIWGSSETERKTHLVSWDRICQPKENGGLGLKSARVLNRAYMTKLAFLFFQNKEPLWIRILQTKYFKETNEGLAPRHTSSQSALWRGLVAEWNTMLKGSRAAVRNGRDTSFWSSSWIDKGVKLLNFASRELSETELVESVADFGNPDGSWNSPKIQAVLSVEGVELVVGMHAPVADSGDDEWAWGCGKDGKFTIKSAYALLCEDEHLNSDALWKTIWGWKGPNRIRHFLWLAGLDKLLTNEQRCRRKHAADPLCPLCLTQIETSLHMLRDCVFAKEVWNQVGGFDTNDSLWSSTREGWMLNLLLSDRNLEFGVICWSLWKSRNARIFSNDHSSAAAVAFKALAWTRTVAVAGIRDARTQNGRDSREQVEIAWDPGPPGWTTVNTDGAVNQSSGKAAAGGLARNSSGQCLGAFAMYIGYCSITRAELRGAIQGLRLAWEIGVRRVVLQVDSMTVVQLLDSPGDPMHQHAMEVRDIRELISRDWEVRVRHVYREANHAADHLASTGFTYPLGIHSISPSDVNLVYFLRYDCFGISESRSILLSN